jgi:hypothetical protein
MENFKIHRIINDTALYHMMKERINNVGWTRHAILVGLKNTLKLGRRVCETMWSRNRVRSSYFLFNDLSAWLLLQVVMAVVCACEIDLMSPSRDDMTVRTALRTFYHRTTLFFS